MKRTPLLTAVLFCLPVLSFLGAQENRALSVNAGIMVFDRTRAADAIALWGENAGGYFIWKSEDGVRLRVPSGAVSELREFLESISETVLEYGQTTRDLREEIASVRSALGAREEILAKNFTYIAESDVEGTLTLEREIRRLMTEIDSYRGRLRVLEHDSRMAVVDIGLSFKHNTLPDARPSNFEWINTVDFHIFMNRPLRPDSTWSWSAPRFSLPPGFAEVDDSPVLLAVTAEGTRLGIRSVSNYPRQNLEFWSGTLKRHLETRGYLPAESMDGGAWDATNPFVTEVWTVPMNGRNYLYITGLRLRGSHIEILEISGDSENVFRLLEEASKNGF